MIIDEEDLERRLDFIVREFDEFVVMAGNPMTVHLINNQRAALGQIHTRVTMILSYVLSQKRVKNG